nr:MAG TPA: hypothetical protein [Caudoviricetes sp.]
MFLRKAILRIKDRKIYRNRHTYMRVRTYRIFGTGNSTKEQEGFS